MGRDIVGGVEKEREMASKRSPFDFLGQESRLLGTPAPGRSS